MTANNSERIQLGVPRVRAGTVPRNTAAALDGDARRRDDATTRVAVPVALGASERRAFADAVAASARASRRGSSGARRATTPRATLERTESERALEALAATATST